MHTDSLELLHRYSLSARSLLAVLMVCGCGYALSKQCVTGGNFAPLPSAQGDAVYPFRLSMQLTVGTALVYACMHAMLAALAVLVVRQLRPRLDFTHLSGSEGAATRDARAQIARTSTCAFAALSLLVTAIETSACACALVLLNMDARGGNATVRAFDRVLAAVFNSVFFSNASKLMLDEESASVWHWVGANCPLEMSEAHCWKRTPFGITSCAADMLLCATGPTGFACPYALCRPAASSIVRTYLSGICVFMLGLAALETANVLALLAMVRLKAFAKLPGRRPSKVHPQLGLSVGEIQHQGSGSTAEESV